MSKDELNNHNCTSLKKVEWIRLNTAARNNKLGNTWFVGKDVALALGYKM